MRIKNNVRKKTREEKREDENTNVSTVYNMSLPEERVGNRIHDAESKEKTCHKAEEKHTRSLEMRGLDHGSAGSQHETTPQNEVVELQRSTEPMVNAKIGQIQENGIRHTEDPTPTVSRSGINIRLKTSQIEGQQSVCITGTTITNGDNKLMYEVEEMIRRYDVSYPTLQRWIDKVPSENRYKSCLSIQNKHFITEDIHPKGRAAADRLKRETMLPSRSGESAPIDAFLPYHVATGLTSNQMVRITGATTDHRVAYYEVETFADMHEIHVNTVRNYVKKLQASSLAKRRDFHRLAIRIDGKLFVTSKVFFLNKQYRKQISNIEYSNWLSEYKWDLVGSVNFFHNHVSQQRCVKIMKKLFKDLKRTYPTFSFQFVFTTEQNDGRDGYHAHFVFGSPDDLPVDQLVIQIGKLLDPVGGRFEAKSRVEPYRNSGNFLEYLAKELHRNTEGWDVEMA